MNRTRKSNASDDRKKARRQYLHIMVVQRLAPGAGPGPVHVVKKVLKEEAFGSTVKRGRMHLPIEHTLPAGTGALTASDRRAFAEEGLTGPEIAYVESKLAGKKVKSDAHKAAFEAGKASRNRERLKKRLVAQLASDPDLAAGVIAALNEAAWTVSGFTPPLPPGPQEAATLSDRVSRLLTLVDEVGRDIEVYKEGAKVGKSYDKDKLRAMLSKEAERDWKLSWFAYSRMVEKASGTPFARPKGWASDEALSKLAATHGHRSAGT